MSKRSGLSIPLALALALAAAVASAGSVQAAAPSAAAGASQAPRTATVLETRVKVTGQVMLIFASGNFRLSTGTRAYRIVMRPTTSVINLRGREVPRQFIQVANKVTVWGRRIASRIVARQVMVTPAKTGRDARPDARVAARLRQVNSASAAAR